MIGVWCNGNMAASKPGDMGSIPFTPAINLIKYED